MERVVLIRYAEIGLKGRNRGYFERKLMENIRKIVKPPEVNKRYGRVVIRLRNQDFHNVEERLKYVFGIQNYSYAFAVSHDINEIKKAVFELVKLSLKHQKTFKVETKRSFKQFPMKSLDFSAYIGGYILENFPDLKVDVHNPDLIVGIEIKEKEVFVFAGKEQLYGGLPVGVSGKALLLLSGGIDSPVAGWYMLKRGLSIETISFLSPPFTTEKSVRKILDLAEKLSKYLPDTMRAWIVPFTDVQHYIKQNVPDRYSLIIQRRSMMRIANRLAKKIKAKALITGENIGQVASQTLTNLHSIEEASYLPVLRPLIGFEKMEIVDKAKKIQTYEISILPYIDSCVAFAPKNPATSSNVKEIRDIEKDLEKLSELEENVLEKAEKFVF
ncbi:MAG: tRNA 4-thiouridine(8) synthase ThiI [Thermosipho sp. (in: Bacteria)]|nr:tRNA 4-thiouridine(8) synthase ThiI [Thermosipho sp. (in: thermotogales)]